MSLGFCLILLVLLKLPLVLDWLKKPMASLLAVPVLVLGAFKIYDYLFSSRVDNEETLNIRSTNWSLYIEYWLNQLGLKELVFGFGSERSREATFFLTSMNSGSGYHVVHIHNFLLEIFYDFGLMALLLIGPILIVGYKAFKATRQAPYRLVFLDPGSLILMIIIAFFAYYSVEVPSAPTYLSLFAALFFFYSLIGVDKANSRQKHQDRMGDAIRS